jgi:hypothetical protein
VPENKYIGAELFDQRAFRRANLVKLAEYMPDDYPAAGDIFQSLGGEAIEPVVIAFDRKDGRNLFEPLDHFELAYVARVNNQVNGSEKLRQRRVKQSVRIGD